MIWQCQPLVYRKERLFKLYKCRFCGYSSDSSDDFEDDFVNQKGYWCPICDGFTYYDEKSDHQSYKLLFETKSHNNTVVHKKKSTFSDSGLS